MNRLALAQTLVSGTVTLQGIAFTFTASGTGTATGNNVTEAKQSAITASNTAASAAARIAIDAILVNNSAVLSDLEITSLISNNFSTTVEVFRPIALKAIANSSDGMNYTLKRNLTIGADESLIISNGQHFETGKYTLKNNGFVQVGGSGDVNITASYTMSTNTDNASRWNIASNGLLTINPGVTFDQINYTVSENYLHNSGIIINNGNIINDTQYSNIYTYSGSQLTNNGTITNAGSLTYIKNNSSAVFTNNGTITNAGPSTVLLNNGATFYNYGSIKNSGKYSYTCSNSYGTWIGSGGCTGNCCTNNCTCP